ncbi:MAG: class I SAM-dependent methyltransferase [Actinomycetia bacterium]|nr:class I SAM-dependent methyltransferase [Actinomycetes bacterium]
MKIKKMKCKFCNGTLEPQIKKGKFNINIGYNICDQCKTAFLDKVKIQSKEYYEEEYEKWFYGDTDKDKAIKNSFTDAAPRVFLISAFIKLKGKKVLDIGCGIGGTLKLFEQLGLKVQGIEPSEKFAAFNREKLDLPVEKGFLGDSRLKNIIKTEDFDLVTAFDVIEHLKDPGPFLAEVKRVMKDDGIFFFTTPHIKKSESSVIFQQSHTILFSLYSTKKILENNGFFISEVVLFGGSLNIFSVKKEKADKNKYGRANSAPQPKYLEDYTKDERAELWGKHLIPLIMRIPRLIYYFLICRKELRKTLKKCK